MAYLFDGVDDVVDFAPGPLNGYTIGPVTIAVFYKPGAISIVNYLVAACPVAGGVRASLRVHTTNADRLTVVAANATGTHTLSDTSKWYLLVVNWAGAGATPRFHVHDGTSWNHANASVSVAANAAAMGATDPIKVGAVSGSFGNSSIVCAAIKKTDVNVDATIETLSRTSFQAWKDFGFDWLVGFDDAATVTNEMAGGGNETSRTGTTLVADPPGWAWSPVLTSIAASRELRYKILGRVHDDRNLRYQIAAAAAVTTGGGISLYTAPS